MVFERQRSVISHRGTLPTCGDACARNILDTHFLAQRCVTVRRAALPTLLLPPPSAPLFITFLRHTSNFHADCVSLDAASRQRMSAARYRCLRQDWTVAYTGSTNRADAAARPS